MIEKIVDIAKRIEEEIIQNRRTLHQMPELGLDLPKTTAFVREQLTQMGYDVADCGPGGLVVVAGQGEKTFLLRADMDALPGEELADVPYRSQTENAHLCGHDMHTAQLLGAARILKEIEAELPGRVKLMFQPAEETVEGAKSMIEHGLLENPKVDAAFAMHVMSTLERGTVDYTRGVASAAMDTFFIEIKGKATHGSMPDKGVDPLQIAAHLYLMITSLAAREASMFDNIVCTIGEMGGGTAPNIVPDTAVLRGTIRSFDKAVRDRFVERINALVENVPMSFAAKGEIKWIPTPSIVNDDGVVDVAEKALAEVFGAENVINTGTPLTGSEDFSYVAARVPAMFVMVGTGGPDEYPVHNPNVVFDESNLAKSAAGLVAVAVRWLQGEAPAAQ